MSVSELENALAERRPAVLSCDLFDTVLLRDHTTQAERFVAGCRRAAPRIGVDPVNLIRLRRTFHGCAYQAVAMRRPDGDASLARICSAVACALGLDEGAARILREAEIEVDVEHLRPNSRLLDVVERFRRGGGRVIALSDMYYSGPDLEQIIGEVVGRRPFDVVYASSDLGLTKHSGAAFGEVEIREDVPGDRILHVGDDHRADVDRARAAGWSAVHLPRGPGHRAARLLGKARAASAGVRGAA